MKAIKLFKLFGTLFLCFLTASYSYADKIRAPKYDFSVVNKSNQQLYFQILSQAEHTVAITKAPYGYRDDEYVFPEKVEYRGVVYDVVAVADKAFYEQDDLDNIVLPKTIRSIGYHAFEDCRFSSFYFPDSLKEEIATEAFESKLGTRYVISQLQNLIEESIYEDADTDYVEHLKDDGFIDATYLETPFD